ncbi:MAG: hypothetical protein DRN91_08765 [Candidatus Alkanophagales archaeon]|nr:MAG: hypothetical protein DRN91_08765 [Candidatus Alkanophagales archaeon]
MNWVIKQIIKIIARIFSAKKIRENHFNRFEWDLDNLYILINFDGCDFWYLRTGDKSDLDAKISKAKKELERFRLVNVYREGNLIEFYFM